MVLDVGFVRTWFQHVTTVCCNGSSTVDLACLATCEKQDCLLPSFFRNNFQLFILAILLILMVGVTLFNALHTFLKIDSKSSPNTMLILFVSLRILATQFIHISAVFVYSTVVFCHSWPINNNNTNERMVTLSFKVSTSSWIKSTLDPWYSSISVHTINH